MKNKPSEPNDIIGSSVTEALNDVDHYKEPEHVSIPKEESVTEARDWNEEHIQ